MSKYFNPRLLNAVIAGTGMRNPVRPHVILGSEDGEFVRGDLMDANAIQEFVSQKIDELVNSAPEALDTLKELADALNDDNNFATTVTNLINSKQDTLVSGVNIKTINGSSILGEGNIEQQQADWNQTDNTAVDYIKNKPTIPSIPDITAVNEALARANNVNATLNGTVVTITNSTGTSNSVDLAAATNERVYITVDSSDGNMNVENLTILVYYNMSQVASETLHTDASGEAFVSVPNTTIYKIVFPAVGGYYTPPTLSYHAVVSQRAVDVVYEKIPQNDCEVTIQVEKKDDTVITKLAEHNIYVTIGNNTTTYQTDSNGRVVLHIQHGQTYSVSTDTLNNYYLATDPSGSYTATDSSKSILYFYLPFRSGLFVIAADGTEYTLDQWQTALANNTVVNADAKLIKIATATLATNHGIFGIDIDEICSGNTFVKKVWSNPHNLAMESIPLNGNSISAQFYYDGKSASTFIQSEGDSRAIDTPAVDEAMNRTVTINGQTINGFLGSVGQYSILQQNISEIDGILRVVRPSTTRVMSNITEMKWTCTQGGGNVGWRWTNISDTSYKNSSQTVLPFYPI